MYPDTHSKKLWPWYVSWINHRNCEPLVPISKLLLLCLLTMSERVSLEIREDKLDRTALARPGSPAVCNAVIDTKITKENGRSRYIAAGWNWAIVIRRWWIQAWLQADYIRKQGTYNAAFHTTTRTRSRGRWKSNQITYCADVSCMFVQIGNTARFFWPQTPTWQPHCNLLLWTPKV